MVDTGAGSGGNRSAVNLATNAIICATRSAPNPRTPETNPSGAVAIPNGPPPPVIVNALVGGEALGPRCSRSALPRGLRTTELDAHRAARQRNYVSGPPNDSIPEMPDSLRETIRERLRRDPAATA